MSRPGRREHGYHPCSIAIGWPSASRTRSIRHAVPRAPSRSALTTSGGGRSSSTRIRRVAGTRPRRRMSSENDARCRLVCTRGRATKVPLPWIFSSSPPTTRLSMALRTVARETSYVVMSSRSEGIEAPGPRSRVASSASTSLSCTCLGRGPSSILRGHVVLSTSDGSIGTVWSVPVGEHGSDTSTLSRTTDGHLTPSRTPGRDADGVGDRRAARGRPPHPRRAPARAAAAARARRRAPPRAARGARVERQRRDLRPLPARGGRRRPRRARRAQRRHPLRRSPRPLGHGGGLGLPVRCDRRDRRDPGVGASLRGRHRGRDQRRGLAARRRRRRRARDPGRTRARGAGDQVLPHPAGGPRRPRRRAGGGVAGGRARPRARCRRRSSCTPTSTRLPRRWPPPTGWSCRAAGCSSAPRWRRR